MSTGHFETCTEKKKGQCWCNTAAFLHSTIFKPPCVTLAYWPTEPCQQVEGVRWKVCVCVCMGPGIQNPVTHNVSSKVTTGQT